MEKANHIMVYCIDILESIHKHFVIHRDIKPQNFMIKDGELFLIDFGLATFYIDENKTHVLNDTSHNYILGTPTYISYNVHVGSSPSRRDDLISIGYMYLFLCNRELPWRNIPIQQDSLIEDEMNILHYKNIERTRQKSWDVFNGECSQTNSTLHKFMEYCYGLSYAAVPNYSALKQLFYKEVTIKS
jgi:casein kinase 1